MMENQVRYKQCCTLTKLTARPSRYDKGRNEDLTNDYNQPLVEAVDTVCLGSAEGMRNSGDGSHCAGNGSEEHGTENSRKDDQMGIWSP